MLHPLIAFVVDGQTAPVEQPTCRKVEARQFMTSPSHRRNTVCTSARAGKKEDVMAKSPTRDDMSSRSDEEGPLTLSTGPDTDRIAQRAYERYEARGREEGRDLEDWLEAEQELRQSPSESTTTPATESGRRTDDAA